MNCEDERTADETANGPKITAGISGVCRCERNDNLGATISQEQGVAVGLLMSDNRAPDRTARTTYILDERWAKLWCYSVDPRTSDLVARSTGRIWYHQSNWT
jgi:hypothetical protein